MLALTKLEIKEAERLAEQALNVNPKLPEALRLRADVDEIDAGVQRLSDHRVGILLPQSADGLPDGRRAAAERHGAQTGRAEAEAWASEGDIVGERHGFMAGESRARRWTYVSSAKQRPDIYSKDYWVVAVLRAGGRL